MRRLVSDNGVCGHTCVVVPHEWVFSRESDPIIYNTPQVRSARLDWLLVAPFVGNIHRAEFGRTSSSATICAGSRVNARSFSPTANTTFRPIATNSGCGTGIFVPSLKRNLKGLKTPPVIRSLMRSMFTGQRLQRVSHRSTYAHPHPGNPLPYPTHEIFCIRVASSTSFAVTLFPASCVLSLTTTRL